jgi:hypothetical protein
MFVAIISGCASHAQINMPVVTEVISPAFENKTFSSEVLYSQPEPGIFSGGKQQELKSIGEQRLSVASASVLKKLPTLIQQQLPKSSKLLTQKGTDFDLTVEMIAHDKKGPAYADHEFLKSLGKNLLTLGFASSEYDIIADFDVKYVLTQKGSEVFTKSYKVKESVDHEKGDFDSFNTLKEFTSQLLEKHLTLTLNDFFVAASSRL